MVDWSKWEDRSHVLIAHRNKSIQAAYVSKQASVQVSVFQHPEFKKITHLWVRRHDDKPMGWTQLQRIKNEIVGYDKMAIQVFPKTKNVVDQANMYHLWVFDSFDFGINENGFIF